MRARDPDREGYVDSHGVPVFWEQYGEGERTVLFASTWQILHSRAWKMQLPYFTSTPTWPGATWPSFRAGSPPAWS